MPQWAPWRDNQGVSRTPRPISARARILGAILAVACVGLAIVGSVTFLVQRENVINEIDNRLRSQVEQLQTISGDTGDVDAEAPSGTTSTARETIDIDRFATVEEFMRAAVGRLVPARNEGGLGVID